jgi:phosphoserine phosphatase
MKRKTTQTILAAACVTAFSYLAVNRDEPGRPISAAETKADPLPSWKDGKTKQAILKFVASVTTKDGPNYVPPEDRIATFDNDGTLWCEQPMYVQLAFALDRVKALADKHPEWKDKEPFKAVLEGDHKALAVTGEKGLVELIMATHAGMTTDEFEAIVKEWLATAKHPKFKRPYTECIYQPMVEVLTYLRANGFKTYVTSGGGIEFMRPWVEQAYGIPREQVIGSSSKTKYEVRDGKGVLVRLPEIDFIDDKADKPVAIQKFIGRRPLMAFGNSDGDFEMLEFATTGTGPRFGLLVHHTDAEREYAYDRKSSFGKLERGLDEASKRGWVVASIKDDWKRVFAFEK